jgi:hypothetical protein
LRIYDGESALDVFRHPYAYAAMRPHRAANSCAARPGLAGSETQPAGARGPAAA